MFIQFGISEQHKSKLEYHWAYASIRLTREDNMSKQEYMKTAQQYFVKTLCTAAGLSETRRDLVCNPCVAKDKALDIYDQMMVFAEQVLGYISITQQSIEYLKAAQTNHHADFDRIATSGAASSPSTQHDQHATRSGD